MRARRRLAPSSPGRPGRLPWPRVENRCKGLGAAQCQIGVRPTLRATGRIGMIRMEPEFRVRVIDDNPANLRTIERSLPEGVRAAPEVRSFVDVADFPATFHAP